MSLPPLLCLFLLSCRVMLIQIDLLRFHAFHSILNTHLISFNTLCVSALVAKTLLRRCHTRHGIGNAEASWSCRRDDLTRCWPMRKPDEMHWNKVLSVRDFSTKTSRRHSASSLSPVRRMPRAKTPKRPCTRRSTACPMDSPLEKWKRLKQKPSVKTRLNTESESSLSSFLDSSSCLFLFA